MKETYIYQDEHFFIFQPGDDFAESIQNLGVKVSLSRVTHRNIDIMFDCPVCSSEIVVRKCIDGVFNCENKPFDKPMICENCLDFSMRLG
jgi:hypothetical protein